MSSASRSGRLSLKEVKLIDIKWKVGSLGFADTIAVAATADAAPMIAELQLHFIFLPMLCSCRASAAMEYRLGEKLE